MPRTLSPALFVLPALVCLPFGRLSEYPLLVLAVFGAAVTIGGSLQRRDMVPWLLALYAAFALPMLLALPDAVNPEKSLLTTLGSLRFVAAGLGMLWLLQRADNPGAQQLRTLHLVGLAAALLLLGWCLDGLLQFLTGRNVLGYGLAEGYINSVFGDGENLKFAITVALLLPLALVHALRHWSPLATGGFLLLVLLLLVLSGKRAAWMTALVELAALAVYYRARGRLALRQLLIGAGVVLVSIAIAFSSSDWVQERSEVLLAAVEEPGFERLNTASGLRLPIWGVALTIGREHWINGVGPRGFRYAYGEYAPSDDRWARPLATGGAKASHAHQLLLEIWCESGVIGLGGWVILVALLLRLWLRASAAARARALPFAAALLGMLFPLNTHAAWYSSWSGLMLWLLLGLYMYALTDAPGAGSTT